MENEILVDKIASFLEREENWFKLKHSWLINDKSDDLRELLHKALSQIDIAPVMHGSWGEGRFNTRGDYEEQCTNRKMFSISYGSDHCPNCGAKMDLED